MTESSTRLLTTAAITACTLFLCIPVAVTTIILDNAHIPNVVLGSRTIDAGPSGSKSLTFGLRTGPDDAVLASAYIAVIASVALALCIALLRHVNSLVRMAGWTSISVATGNFAAQLGCVIAWGILVTKDEAQHAEKEDITRSENGEKYETKRMFTREAWACSMKTLYSEREGAWAPKACDDLRSARMLTVLMVIFAIILAGFAYWQVYMKGGFIWLRGGVESREIEKKVAFEE